MFLYAYILLTAISSTKKLRILCLSKYFLFFLVQSLSIYIYSVLHLYMYDVPLLLHKSSKTWLCVLSIGWSGHRFTFKYFHTYNNKKDADYWLCEFWYLSRSTLRSSNHNFLFDFDRNIFVFFILVIYANGYHKFMLIVPSKYKYVWPVFFILYWNLYWFSVLNQPNKKQIFNITRQSRQYDCIVCTLLIFKTLIFLLS